MECRGSAGAHGAVGMCACDSGKAKAGSLWEFAEKREGAEGVLWPAWLGQGV
jgi:hypothetical protein